MKKEWPLGEVFIRGKNELSHKHAGSLHAADAGMAIGKARDDYSRSRVGVTGWGVECGLTWYLGRSLVVEGC